GRCGRLPSPVRSYVAPAQSEGARDIRLSDDDARQSGLRSVHPSDLELRAYEPGEVLALRSAARAAGWAHRRTAIKALPRRALRDERRTRRDRAWYRVTMNGSLCGQTSIRGVDAPLPRLSAQPRSSDRDRGPRVRDGRGLRDADAF